MSAIDGAIGIALALCVIAIWLGCLAMLRLRAALDRLHAVAFVNVAGGFLLTLTAFLADGVSIRSMKVLAIYLLLLLSGAALSHATGRALLIREGRKA